MQQHANATEINVEWLTTAIEAAEEGLLENGKHLPADQKAQLIVAAYQLISEEHCGQMATHKFKDAVRDATKRPKGVFVSLNLFRALDAENSLERKLSTPWGLPAPSLGIDLPYYDKDVFVGCDPALDGFDFKLPSA